jgi:hypothetical protein
MGEDATAQLERAINDLMLDFAHKASAAAGRGVALTVSARLVPYGDYGQVGSGYDIETNATVSE